MKAKELNYQEAFDELKEIVDAIEEGDISIDEISTKVKRAAILLKVCKDKLSQTEIDVNAILKQIEDEEA